MMFDLGQLRVEGLIVHDIPRHSVHDETAGGPELSDLESDTNQVIRNFFRERMATALGRRAFAVELNPQPPSPIPELIRSFLTDSKNNLVTTSQRMATHLYDSQSGVNPGGLLTVARGKVEGRKAIAVMKLERDEGTRVSRAGEQGHRTFSVSHVRDLMLTGRTRVFKVGLFSTLAPGDIRGLVCDEQVPRAGTVAYFFLQTFLGCQFLETPELVTERAWELGQQFFNEAIDDPETKGRYQVALTAELASNRTSVSLEEFATNHLDPGDRLPFLEKYRLADIPTRSFAKDTRLIQPQLRRVQWTFQSDISVLADPEVVGNQLAVSQLDDGRTRLEVTDLLKNITGHR